MWVEDLAKSECLVVMTEIELRNVNFYNLIWKDADLHMWLISQMISNCTRNSNFYQDFKIMMKYIGNNVLKN